VKFKLLTATSAESGEIRKAPSHIAAAKVNVQLIRCRETQLLLAGYTPTDMTTIDRAAPMGPTHTEGRSADEHKSIGGPRQPLSVSSAQPLCWAADSNGDSNSSDQRLPAATGGSA